MRVAIVTRTTKIICSAQTITPHKWPQLHCFAHFRASGRHDVLGVKVCESVYEFIGEEIVARPLAAGHWKHDHWSNGHEGLNFKFEWYLLTQFTFATSVTLFATGKMLGQSCPCHRYLFPHRGKCFFVFPLMRVGSEIFRFIPDRVTTLPWIFARVEDNLDWPSSSGVGWWKRQFVDSRHVRWKYRGPWSSAAVVGAVLSSWPSCLSSLIIGHCSISLRVETNGTGEEV